MATVIDVSIHKGQRSILYQWRQSPGNTDGSNADNIENQNNGSCRFSIFWMNTTLIKGNR